MLLLPTGVGGVLYRPRFFNLSIAFSRELWEVTPRGDDLTFRIATLAMGIKVYTACILGDFKDKKKVTNCPDLNGVDFHYEKIARRLSVKSDNVTILHSGEGSSESVGSIGSKSYLRRSLQVTNSTDIRDVVYSRTNSVHIGTEQSNHTTTRMTSAIPTTTVITPNTPTTPTTTTTSTTTTIPHTPVLVDIAPPKRNVDHGDKGSLSSLNSKHDGNFHQWNKATHYLKEANLFDINAFIQPHVVTERTPCIVHPALLNYNRDSWVGSITGTVMENLQTLTEHYRDDSNRCGIVSCKNSHG